MDVDESGLRRGILALRDTDGYRHAAPLTAVRGIHETESGTVIALWNRVVTVDVSYDDMLIRLGWGQHG
ncbi:hypothetical protein [Azospirillum sp.]|uniref:hypothetical protein n=1 Tax=Azospirillum sp. TaxID=34012 RepID=UPI003D70B260